jgi:Uma2 family endonuclease
MPVSPQIIKNPDAPFFRVKDISPATKAVKKTAPNQLIDPYFLEEDPPLESDWHVAAMTLLIDIIEFYWKHRTDVYISGNTAVRFDPAGKKNQHFRGPDFYVIKNVPKGFRDSWVTWEENGFTPDLVIELASRTTAHIDLHDKKDVYELKLKTGEYIIYNPKTDQLLGWRLTGKRYQPIQPNQDGFIWCDEVGLFLGVVEHDFSRARGTVKTPRFFDKDGHLLPTAKEAEAQRAEKEQQQKEQALQREKQALQRAQAEAQRAEKEQQQKEQALQRAEKLAKILREQGIDPDKVV